MRMLRPFMTFALAALLAVAAFVVRLFEPLASEPLSFGGDHRLALSSPGGDQISASAFHGLRHESRTPRRSADRHI